MIVTVDPNPSLDRTLTVEALVVGDLVRATAPATLAPSGKAVNVALALHVNDIAVTTVLPAGGPAGALLVELLDAPALDYRQVKLPHEVRSNVSIVEPGGTVTKVNEPGPTWTAADAAVLREAVTQAAWGASWLVGCGSLPPGLDPGFYASLRSADYRLAVDTSGAALRLAVDAGVDLVKPNLPELQELTGRNLYTVGDVLAAAERIRAAGVGAVLASLGAGGAVLVSAGGAAFARAAAFNVGSAVGAGDAMLAGFLAAGGDGRDALVNGLAWASAACTLPGTAVPRPADIAPFLRVDAIRCTDRIPLDAPIGATR